jgi:hypothetical protein
MRVAVMALSAVLLWPAAVLATTYLVRPDGTGDFPTIQAAVGAAADGDVIELADGTFQGDGNRDISYLGKAITVRSQSGNPEACILDCGGPRGFRFESGEDANAILMGVTVTGAIVNDYGWPDGCGGAVRCLQAGPTIRHCVFYDNQCREAGAAIFCESGSLDVSDCRFDENRTAISSGIIDGGGIACYGSSLTLSDCTFYFNSAVYGGGISLRYGSAATVAGCTFTFNVAPLRGGSIYCEGSSLMLTGSTLFFGGVLLAQAATVSLENTIIASTIEDAGIRCDGAGGSPSLSCCDLFDNGGGDWVGCVASQYGTDGNLSADALFCDPDYGDVTLRSDSPCAAENNPECGQIGSLPVACGPTAAEQTTWGALKALFR